MEAGLLEAAVQQGVDQYEGQYKKEPEDKSDAEHSNESVFYLLRVVQHYGPEATPTKKKVPEDPKVVLIRQ